MKILHESERQSAIDFHWKWNCTFSKTVYIIHTYVMFAHCICLSIHVACFIYIRIIWNCILWANHIHYFIVELLKAAIFKIFFHFHVYFTFLSICDYLSFIYRSFKHMVAQKVKKWELFYFSSHNDTLYGCPFTA